MKWSYTWLQQHAQPSFPFDERVMIDPKRFASIPNLLGIHDIRVHGEGVFQSSSGHLRITFVVEGIMIVPCARTLEPLDYHFSTDWEQTFVFGAPTSDAEIGLSGNVVDLEPLILEQIITAVPLRVVKPGAAIPSEGRGWSFQEEDLNESSDPSLVDPRLAKLKDFFKEK
jgi:uncharacterized protein